jgi:regulatory protein
MARRSTGGGAETAPPPTSQARPFPSGERLPEDIASDPDADPESVARTICLRLLTIRDRTRAELTEALAARQVPTEVAGRVLGRLGEVGLIDDCAFAATFAQTRQSERGLSAREITRQLRNKGVAAEVAAQAVAGIDQEAERRTARQLVERRLRGMTRLDGPAKTRRLVALLARKGYSPAVAYGVVREVIGADSTPIADDESAWLA